jgi:ribA/ribD-fused uncharacterized protein
MTSLPLNLKELQTAVAAGGSFRWLYFWGHQSKSPYRIGNECFSQWHPSSCEINQILYPTAEHYMMAEKARVFGDEEVLEKILKANTPGEAKALGRQVRGFSDDVWNQVRIEIVERGNLAKFSQNAELGQYLRTTGEQILVEASPVDRIWGVGLAATDPLIHDPLQWKGLNLLGFALMKVRSLL